MFHRAVSVAGVALFALAVSGCVGAEKSANPLSPTVAGPIPGVGITSPNLVQPINARIAVDQQPVTLIVSNSATTGVRPLTYLFEIATDAAFNNKVFTRDGVAPGATQTSLRLPDPLATGRTYYWRAKAQDGANASDYSNIASFDVYTPIVIQAPTLVSPVGGTTTSNNAPRFTISNAPRSGPVGSIVYVIEVADSDSFANKMAIWTIGEQANTTSLDAPGALPSNAQLFWRARAADSTTAGPYSATAVFKTPAAPAPPPSGGGSGGSGGGGGGGGNYASLDQINLSAAHIVGGGPSDIGSWTVSSNISSLEFSPVAGLKFTFPGNSFWPDYTPPGWDGPIQYTVWACIPQNGWTCGGFIQMWRDRGYTGAPLPSNYIYWWGNQGGVTSGIFGGYVPHAGDKMAFFVAAGDERGGSATLTRERSNVVIVTLPGGDSGFFSF
jgi:hypothetical protein